MESASTPLARQVSTAMRATILVCLVTGVIFPVILTLLGQMLFAEQANGSLIRRSDSTVIGSRLIGQPFVEAKYFHPRPSAAGSGYAGESSSGTNIGPTTAKLVNGDKDYAGIKQLAQQYRKENSLPDQTPLPADALTRSGSGLDPDISPENAMLQAARVASARKIDVDAVKDLIRKRTQEREFGVLGEPRVNVLLLNMDLDRVNLAVVK